MNILVLNKKTRDPVCGMAVDENSALSLILKKQTYYFCSQSCLAAFAGARGMKVTGRRLIRRPATFWERLRTNNLFWLSGTLVVLLLVWIIW